MAVGNEEMVRSAAEVLQECCEEKMTSTSVPSLYRSLLAASDKKYPRILQETLRRLIRHENIQEVSGAIVIHGKELY